jgi:DNA-binding NarL/FixJ family response regulator
MKSMLIVEDHADTLQWLSGLIGRAFPAVELHQASTFAAGIHALKTFAPELALIDIELPDGCGIDLIKEATRLKLRTHCVVSTVFDDERHIFPALRAGARGYILKYEAEDKLLERLREAGQGEPPLSSSVAQSMLRHFSQGAREYETLRKSLSPREREILIAVTNGYSVAEIAKNLGVSQHTVQTHVKHLNSKLNAGSRAELVMAAVRLGLVHQDS